MEGQPVADEYRKIVKEAPALRPPDCVRYHALEREPDAGHEPHLTCQSATAIGPRLQRDTIRPTGVFRQNLELD